MPLILFTNLINTCPLTFIQERLKQWELGIAFDERFSATKHNVKAKPKFSIAFNRPRRIWYRPLGDTLPARAQLSGSSLRDVKNFYILLASALPIPPKVPLARDTTGRAVQVFYSADMSFCRYSIIA